MADELTYTGVADIDLGNIMATISTNANNGLSLYTFFGTDVAGILTYTAVFVKTSSTG